MSSRADVPILYVCASILCAVLYIYAFLVQEALARIGSEAYILTSAQMLINSMLAKHEQPAVLSAVMKFQTTSRARQVANDAMDVVGGAGVCRGPNNLIGNTYMSIPIAITVEGKYVRETERDHYLVTPVGFTSFFM